MIEREKLTREKSEALQNLANARQGFVEHIAKTHGGKVMSTCHRCNNLRSIIEAEILCLQDFRNELAEG